MFSASNGTAASNNKATKAQKTIIHSPSSHIQPQFVIKLLPAPAS
jgi:hypothetical protein